MSNPSLMGLTVNITPDESKMLRKLFSKKAESANLREEGIEGGKRKKDEAPEDGSARKMRYQGSSKIAENADETAAAQQDLGASVQFLLLDQIVPKKHKDGGAARLFGKDRRGNSVVVWVKDFRPYFFFPAPRLENDQPLSSAHLIQLCIDLNERCGDKNCSSPVLGITIEDHTELYYYRSKGPSPYLRVSLEAHEKMNKVALALEKMSSSQNPSTALPLRWPAACEPWETNISAQMRFFSDLSISGGSWIEVPARQAMQSKTTRCGLELECSFSEVKSLTHDIADNIFAASCAYKPRGNEQDVAPLTVMRHSILKKS
jgi:DNA polymerase elongation subunit (family B)